MDKNVTISVDTSVNPPAWTFSGDVDPNDSQVIDVPPDLSVTVRWTLAGTNVRFSGRRGTDEPDPIEFVGGVEDPWASGSTPQISRLSDTQVMMVDNNSAMHSGARRHYYKISVYQGQTLLVKDPEVKEEGV